MSQSRSVDTYFWDDPWVQRCDPAQRYLYLYFLTNPLANISGVYEISMERIKRDTTLEDAEIVAIMGTFRAAKKTFMWNDWIVMRNWPKHQTKSPKVQRGIERVLLSVPYELLQFLVEVDYQYPQLKAVQALRLPPPGADTIPKPACDTISIPYGTEEPGQAEPQDLSTSADTISDQACDTISEPEKRPDTISHSTLLYSTLLNSTQSGVAAAATERKHSTLESIMAGLRKTLTEEA